MAQQGAQPETQPGPQRGWLLAVGAGLVSGVLFLSLSNASVFALLLVYASPLPLAIVTLGWGPGTGMTAGLTATALVSLGLGTGGALQFLLAFAAPIFVLARQALTSRVIWSPDERSVGDEAGTSEDLGEDLGKDPDEAAAQVGEVMAPRSQGRGTGRVEFYPLGRLLVWIAGLGLLLFGAVFVTSAGMEGGLQGAIRRGLPEAMPQLDTLIAQWREAGADISRELFLDLAARYIPAAAILLWSLVMLMNLTLGQSIVKLSGRAMRPDFDWTRVELPFPLATALAGALVLSMAPGEAGFVGLTMTLVLGLPYWLTGLVSIHVLSRAWAEGGDTPEVTRGVRFIGIAFLYFLLLAEPRLTSVLICLVGIVDQGLGLRTRVLAAPTPV